MLIRGALVVLVTYWTGYWIAGLAVAVLLLIWGLLSTAEGPPVLALALTYQWMQVTIGIFYSVLTGEELEAMYQTDWQRMVLIGLGWVTCLAPASCSLGGGSRRSRMRRCARCRPRSSTSATSSRCC
jgi:hypothetical protein